jgi:hypothetical protein
MAEKTAPIALGYGTPAWSEYTAAQQEARDILAQRNNRLFDPTYLAMAQGFFAPTKTGSFGESLGNVAAMVGPAQQAEEKRTMDMAKMRMELAQQGLQTSIQAQNAEQDQAAFNARAYKAPTPQPAAPVAGMPPPVAPPAAPVLQPPSGALAQAAPPPVAPAVAPPVAPPSPLAQATPPVAPLAPQPAQPAPAQPSGQQLFPAQPTTWDAEETEFASRQRRAGKPMGEIMKEIDEMRRKNIIVNERGATNIKTGQVFSPVDPTPTDVRLPDGTTHVVTKTMASRLAGAQAAGNAEEYFKIVDQIQKGMTRPPPVAGAQGAPAAAPAPAPAVAPVGRPRTKEEEEASAAQTKAEATKRGESREGRTNTVLDAVKAAEDTRIIAQSAKDVINQPNSELFMGIFEKPKIKTALAKMVEDTVFAPTNFREAITSMNIALSVPRNPDESTKDYTARKQDVMDRYIEATTLMAQAKFAASLLSKGQGTITDGERKLFADTTINTKMSVGAFNKISDMLIERSKFAESLGSKLAQNKMQIDDFKQTPEYKKMAREYEGRLSSILRGGRPAASSSGGRPDIDAAQANVERQLR